MPEWYVSRGGQSSGPMTLEQVQQMAQTGQLGPDTYVAGPGVSGWTPAAQVPQLGAAPMAPQPMAPQPMMAAPAMPMGGGPAMGGMGMGAAPPGAGVVAAPGAQQAPPEPKSDWIKERLRGLGAIGIALLVLVLNVVSILVSESFYPQSLIVGIGALGYGGWVIIFGDEYDDYTLELVRWKQIGMYGCAAVGALIGLALSAWLAG